MSVIFEAENYRGLKKVRWAPSGVCALVGPNGSGKTTLLRLGGLFRFAVERTLNESLAVSGGEFRLETLRRQGIRLRYTSCDSWCFVLPTPH